MRLTNGLNTGDLMAVIENLRDSSAYRAGQSIGGISGAVVAYRAGISKISMKIPIYNNNRFEHFLAHILSGTIVMLIACDGVERPSNKSLVLAGDIVGWVWTELLVSTDVAPERPHESVSLTA